MKKFLQLTLVAILFASCSKQNDLVEPPIDPFGVSQLFFQDLNLAVYSIKASNNNSTGVKINFSTLYEKNITKLELMSGETPNYLCAIHAENLNVNSTQLKSYQITESNPKASTMYYKIRYSLKNGDSGYTKVLKFQRGN
jgi:hypothetical protein